jgi:hypothetical protein
MQLTCRCDGVHAGFSAVFAHFSNNGAESLLEIADRTENSGYLSMVESCCRLKLPVEVETTSTVTFQIAG